MEKLPNQFMFKHYSDDNVVYAASRFNNEYLVTFINNEKEPEVYSHLVEHVEHYIKNYIWVIV